MTDEVYIRESGVEDCEHLEVCEHACRTGCRAYKPRVDRDALLELVDEMETADPEDLNVAIDYVTDCASRIREALGVES